MNGYGIIGRHERVRYNRPNRRQHAYRRTRPQKEPVPRSGAPIVFIAETRSPTAQAMRRNRPVDTLHMRIDTAPESPPACISPHTAAKRTGAPFWSTGHFYSRNTKYHRPHKPCGEIAPLTHCTCRLIPRPNRRQHAYRRTRPQKEPVPRSGAPIVFIAETRSPTAQAMRSNRPVGLLRIAE